MAKRSTDVPKTYRQLLDTDGLRLVIGHLTTVRATVVAAYLALERQASGFDVEIAESLRRCAGDALFRGNAILEGVLSTPSAGKGKKRHSQSG